MSIVAQQMISEEEKAMKAGGESSITPPLTRNLEELEAGGEDMLIFNLAVFWNHWPEMKEVLEVAKQEAMDTGNATQVEIFGDMYLVHPSGSGFGYGYARYKIEMNGITLAIQDRKENQEDCYNVRVLAGSLICMYLKAEGVYEYVEKLIEALGGTLRKDQVSRVDMCVDIANMDITDFVKAQIEKRYITRARHRACYWDGQKEEGVQIGKGDLVARAYEKSLETKKQGLKWEYICQCRYGCRPEKAVRVEIQIRREMLKEMGIETYRDYQSKKSEIIEYVISKWLRMTERYVDRDNNHQNIAEDSELWKQVKKAFYSWVGKPQRAVKRIKTCKIKVESLLKQALGCLQSAIFEDTGALCERPQAFLGEAFVMLSEMLSGDGEDYYGRVLERNMEKMIKRKLSFDRKSPKFRFYEDDKQYDFDWSTGEMGVVQWS